ncbi:hypothetical protein V1J52_15990 [Streptomyces sp. TRM 70351]|uniref:hypothetical protein n=1 Tax=Streptomyces sp. TRM 70351 TaxID=3116552 RepID=UPI002E7BFCDE|nr:hypothetical protein [Streptomyces sp. TRM 70351]MEE1929668.1 hypothetical protein [Streptomyces sp. TRM 70351]
MTAGNNGTNTPEGDDPFGYLYRQEDGAPAQGPQQGTPRTSYHQVRPVGERRYGNQAPQQAAPQQQYPQQPGGTYPGVHYAAPETQPGGREAARREGTRRAAGSGAHGGGHGAPQRRNGLLIAALAVVGAVVIGVGAAVAFSGDDDAKNAGADTSAAGQAQGGDGQQDGGDSGDGGKKDEAEAAPLPSEDASSLRLDGGPQVAADVQGSKARDGKYVAPFNQPGAAATWTAEVPEAGQYTVYVGYTVPGKDMNATLTLNGEPQNRPLNMKNFARAKENDWAKGWTQTYAWVELKEGTNTVRVSCEEGNACDFALDRVWLEKGHVGG